MLTTALGILLPLVGQILMWLFEQKKISKELVDNYFVFVKKAGEDTGSVRLKKLSQTQEEWLRANPWPAETSST